MNVAALARACEEAGHRGLAASVRVGARGSLPFEVPAAGLGLVRVRKAMGTEGPDGSLVAVIVDGDGEEILFATEAGVSQPDPHYNSNRHTFRCDDGLWARVQATARARGCTDSDVIRAALAEWPALEKR